MTPLKAIRKFCLSCYGGNTAEVSTCPDECELWALRSGKGIKGESTLKAIKKKCLWCMNGSRQDVRDCPTKNCEIYIYRLGHNPARKGIGNKEFNKTAV
jgi:hypothetical protein